MKPAMKTIKHGGAIYPLAFDFNVLESIEEEFGGLDIWQEKISKNSGSFGAMISGFKACLNEGIDIENERTGSIRNFLNHKQAGRLLGELGLETAAESIAELTREFMGAEKDLNNSQFSLNQNSCLPKNAEAAG
jgi:hypothetical protein